MTDTTVIVQPSNTNMVQVTDAPIVNRITITDASQANYIEINENIRIVNVGGGGGGTTSTSQLSNAAYTFVLNSNGNIIFPDGTYQNTAYTGSGSGQDNVARDTANSAYNKANSANVIASSAYDQANLSYSFAANNSISANAWANTIFGYSNAYTVTVGAASNGWTNTVVAGANAWTNTVFGYSNTYAQAVGDAGNTYTGQIANNSNAYAQSVGVSANTYANNTFLKLTGGTVNGDLNISGNLTLTGNTSFINVSTYQVDDPLIYLAGNNYTSDLVDIGFVANYNNGACSTVHTGLIRDSANPNKEWYLFQGYDKEPDNNVIDPNGNNFTIAVLNATLRTSNVILNGANLWIWINNAYTQANASPGISNSYAVTVGTASNGWSNTVGTSANAYTVTVGAASNGWSNTVVAGANAWTNTVHGYINTAVSVAQYTANLAYDKANISVSSSGWTANAGIFANAAGYIVSRPNVLYTNSNNEIYVSGTVRSYAASGNDTISTSLGYMGIPQNSKSADYTLALTDQGKQIYLTTNNTITIPANSSVAFPVGTTIVILTPASITANVSITTDTLFLAGIGSTGTRTVSPYGAATLIKVTNTTWYISGAGVA